MREKNYVENLYNSRVLHLNNIIDKLNRDYSVQVQIKVKSLSLYVYTSQPYR